MKVILICLICLTCFILVLFIPIFLNAKFYINITKNINVVSIKLFKFIPIKTVQFSFYADYIKILKNNDDKKIELNFSNFNFLNMFFKNLFLYISLKKLYLFFCYGNKNNAMQTAFVCGVLEMIICVLLSFLNNNKNTNTKYLREQRFDESKFDFSGETSVVFLPITVLLSFLKTKNFFRRKYGRK